MKISVLSPNYNHARFIRQNIEGVLAQTYPDWELILVDDGSTDDSASIIKEYAARDSRIKPIFFPANKGVTAAAQAAHQGASGELFYGSAMDDYICNPNFFALAIESLREFPAAAGFFARTSVIDPDTMAEKWVMGHSQIEGFLPPRDALFSFLYSQMFVPGSSAIWKRDLFNRCGGYDEALGPQCDYYINHAIPALSGVVFSKAVVTACRLFTDSYSGAAKDSQFFLRHALVEKKFRSLKFDYPVDVAWFRTWRDNVINGRLAVTRQSGFIQAVRSQLTDIQPWELSALPERFLTCKTRLLEDCDLLDKELAARVAEAEAIFHENAGKLPCARQPDQRACR